MAKRALCIGINDYPGTGSDLAGCVNDAHDWRPAPGPPRLLVRPVLGGGGTTQGMGGGGAGLGAAGGTGGRGLVP